MLKLFTFIPRNTTASSYYRQRMLFDTAADLGLPVQCKIDTDDAGISMQEHVDAFTTADLCLMYQPVSAQAVEELRKTRSILPSKVEGQWKYPPTIVVDSDDNLMNVNPYNGAFRTLGIRDETGKDIPVGHLIGTLENGERRVLWRDGHEGFDIARNRESIQSYRVLVEMADAFTCSRQPIADALTAETKPTRVKVFPNVVRMDHYEQLDLAPHQGVKILWQGGGAHYEDFFPLRDAFATVTQKYPQVHWIMWGGMFPWATELIPPDRYTYLKWAPYYEYRLRRVMIGEDINLAPLAPNRFNVCRSAIKWYEASVQKRPSATLAQATGPYLDEIQEGETGLLFRDPEHFVEQLSRLIEDETLRKTLGRNAKDWVNENRNAIRETPKHIAYLEQLREETKRELPHMPEEAWKQFIAKHEQEVEQVAAGV